jgi:hypothetical protein
LKKRTKKLFCSASRRGETVRNQNNTLHVSPRREAEQKSFFGYFFFKKSNCLPSFYFTDATLIINETSSPIIGT